MLDLAQVKKELELQELFEEVCCDVMHELGLENWWDLVDSDDFAIVENRLAAYHDNPVYQQWVNDCAMSL